MKSSGISKCPCCGQSVVAEYEICPTCSWENDPIQTDHPDLAGGANHMSLNEAKAAFKDGTPIE